MHRHLLSYEIYFHGQMIMNHENLDFCKNGFIEYNI